VLNGVVLASEVKTKIASGWPLARAVREGAQETMRAVLTTGAVAAFGFLPMALATGAGAEVQRPLATVVVSGILLSTLLTLFLLPGLLRLLVRSPIIGVRHASKATPSGSLTTDRPYVV
jgi:cobalt-zinc-cadmium resistance protein CzcA